MPEHNPDPAIAEKPFRELAEDIRTRILKYRFSIQILPADMEDRDILQVFARLNSTGLQLNPQELRNAKWFGKFKTAMFDLGYEQLERWLDWKIFSTDQVSRMQEVELVSDLVVNIMQGLTAKNQRILDAYYNRYDGQFKDLREVERRFRVVMDSIEELYGTEISKSAFSRVMHFFTLFAFVYDRLFELGSGLKRTPPKPLPQRLRSRLDDASRRFLDRDLPPTVLEAVSGAATDLSKRKTRLDFVRSIADGKTR